MYSAKIEMSNGKILNLGYDFGILFDISPLSGVDVDMSTAMPFQQMGEIVESETVLGISREISGVFSRDEKMLSNQLLSTITPFSSGRLYVGDYYCDFHTKKTPLIFKEKSGKVTFDFVIFCPLPFWLSKNSVEYTFGGVIPEFSFPTTLDNHKFGEIKPVEATNCYNSGNVKQVAIFEFGSLTTTTNFGLRNATTGKFLQIKETLSNGDIARVYQASGKVNIKVYRNGEEYNAISKLVELSSLFELEVGDNVLIPFADEGVENMTVYVRFSPAYSGVIV